MIRKVVLMRSFNVSLVRIGLLAALAAGALVMACSNSSESADDDDVANGGDGSVTLEDGAILGADGAVITNQDGSSSLEDGGVPVGPLGNTPGITGTFAGTTYTYTGNVQLGTIGATNMVAFAALDGGSFNALQKWTINRIPATPGKYACGDPSTSPNIQLILADQSKSFNSIGPDAGCTIDLLSISSNSIEGKFTGSFTDNTGALVPINDGYFFKPNPDLGPPLKADETGGSFTINGVNYRYPNATNLAFETFAGVTISSPSNPIGVQLHTLPNAPGTYACGYGALYRNLNIWFIWDNFTYYYAGNRQSATAEGPAGSSCSVTIDHVGTIGAGSSYTGTIDGSFSGTFVTTDGKKSIVVTNGLFRYTGK